MRVLALLLVCLKIVVVQAGETAPNYFMRFWPVERGLPQSKVSAVVQTRDGYLWVGTYSGLARFDGAKFTVFDEKNTPAMQSSRVTALYEADDGILWIGHENGTVTTFKDGNFRAEKAPKNWNGGKILAITAGENGDVWLLLESGLLARLPDGLEISLPAGPYANLLSHARDLGGKFWLSRGGKIFVLDHAQLKPVDFGEAPASTYIQGICAAHDGGIWVVSRRIRKWDGKKWTQDLGVCPWDMAPLTCFMETKSGALVAGTSSDGFYILPPNTNSPPLHFNRANGFPEDWIIAMLEDHEGNLWLGTGGNGLVSLHPGALRTVAPPDNWRGRAVLSVLPARDGSLWIGTEGSGLYHYSDGAWEHHGYTNGIGNSYIWSIAETTAGRLFVGTWAAGLFERHDGRFKFAQGAEDQLLRVPALLAARDGGLWVGTDSGLFHYRDGETNWLSGAGTNSSDRVCAMAESANGSLWFGTGGNGLACLEQNQIRRWRRADGLPNNYIECLRFDGDVLWMGTSGGGLCRLKNGVFSTIDTAQGLPNSVIGDIEDDDHGYFWISSHGGLFRASKEELNACADGKTKSVAFMVFGMADGMPTIECSDGMQPAGAKTANGHLWFPTTKGLVEVNPAAIYPNPLPPPIVLEGFSVDGLAITNFNRPIKIPPGGSHFEFHYTGLSFVAPEKMQFRFRIEGLEDHWKEAGNKRVAEYSYLPPGDHVFHVIGCNNDGVWNETGVSLSFTVLPHFWQTWWFQFLSGLSTVLVASTIVWIVARRRMQRRLEKLEREKAVERERARIAKDIHDDLGASLTQITMLSQSGGGELESSASDAKNLERIFGTARELTRSMDEIVWAVNPKHDTFESLANYLEKFGFDYLDAAGIRCRLDLPAHLPAHQLTPEVRHNLFLAYKEALHNIVKHAAASEVHISLGLAGDSLELVVEDNGRGFSLNQKATNGSRDRASAGNGLENMQRRIREIGGECHIDSESGRGTKVRFQLLLKLQTVV